jgi:hypothetical protein
MPICNSYAVIFGRIVPVCYTILQHAGKIGLSVEKPVRGLDVSLTTEIEVRGGEIGIRTLEAT